MGKLFDFFNNQGEMSKNLDKYAKKIDKEFSDFININYKDKDQYKAIIVKFNLNYYKDLDLDENLDIGDDVRIEFVFNRPPIYNEPDYRNIEIFLYNIKTKAQIQISQSVEQIEKYCTEKYDQVTLYYCLGYYLDYLNKLNHSKFRFLSNRYNTYNNVNIHYYNRFRKFLFGSYPKIEYYDESMFIRLVNLIINFKSKINDSIKNDKETTDALSKLVVKATAEAITGDMSNDPMGKWAVMNLEANKLPEDGWAVINKKPEEDTKSDEPNEPIPPTLPERVISSYRYLTSKINFNKLFFSYQFNINNVTFPYIGLFDKVAIVVEGSKGTDYNPDTPEEIRSISFRVLDLSLGKPTHIASMYYRDYLIILKSYFNDHKKESEELHYALGFAVHLFFNKLFNFDKNNKPNKHKTCYYYYNNHIDESTGLYPIIGNEKIHNYFCNIINNICNFKNITYIEDKSVNKMMLNDLYKDCK